MIRWAILLMTVVVAVARGEVPRFLQDPAGDFTAATFAEAVNHFVALGEKAAVKELEGLVYWFPDEAKVVPRDFDEKFRINERIGWVCRVLFDGKKENLRELAIGRLPLPRYTMLDKDWPRYPVVLSGSTYFILSDCYSLMGLPENPKDYIQYCVANGVFRQKPVVVPTGEQALADAEALRKSPAWLAIRWKDHGFEWSYEYDEKHVWQFIRKQATGIR